MLLFTDVAPQSNVESKDWFSEDGHNALKMLCLSLKWFSLHMRSISWFGLFVDAICEGKVVVDIAQKLKDHDPHLPGPGCSSGWGSGYKMPVSSYVQLFAFRNVHFQAALLFCDQTEADLGFKSTAVLYDPDVFLV